MSKPESALPGGPFVSVIVPVLNDSRELAELLDTLEPRDDVEVVVARSGASDDRLQARFPRINWIETAPGRAVQMNAGSAQARGRWLLFLHADARLSPGWVEEIRGVARDGRYLGGSFAFSLRSDLRSARIVEWGVKQRVRWFGLPYGDQALFIRRDVFDALGGYRALPLMEDVDMVRRLRGRGPMKHLTLPVRVSARRWELDGWFRRTMSNTTLVLLYFAGVAPDRLARIYYRGRR